MIAAAYTWPAVYAITATVVILLLIAIGRELMDRRKHRSRSLPPTLFADGGQCAAHAHWKALQERNKARARANTLPPFEPADSESFNPRR